MYIMRNAVLILCLFDAHFIIQFKNNKSAMYQSTKLSLTQTYQSGVNNSITINNVSLMQYIHDLVAEKNF